MKWIEKDSIMFLLTGFMEAKTIANAGQHGNQFNATNIPTPGMGQS